ncbi:hypothetical protein CPAST_c34990 [Clostridium pasteurianum DSM 525 = ATCC 6013]|uniref:Uncharacterized protein n=1 Tax=Clostridium pasteurianum DSM 525 = ATCC 6013 TaxID=1262449 RepID=A0A0H3JBD9_CLOPA|nr:hypothetical protein [Clostridium pasteurianum]AJA49560.1 hypothetical protein CPAST_c34990 [Clostridium pasteurianum DSM 525 = ATCC 6013]AJA53548.1 hypothetical protein CLPA_c34990 [Clostridium pasteurianum DSM 525 = ATCC 6013]AOZ76714.1 hypothetical protein AQ983_16990 [Clostridium pasteurianum DSM 525 = ATCC 6013]AOZ80511.1 hypothetical protein AQ984_16985 [Clostridium pasteurianum]ELP58924.1 hypothetical protein F502_12386 [Clostridium pasteurianum DSM 525 = ATCC 6013]
MNEYKFLKEFYKSAALINPKNIIIQEVDIARDFVCIYIVTKNKNMLDIFTAVGDIDEPINKDSINHVLLPESLIKQLFKQQIK